MGIGGTVVARRGYAYADLAATFIVLKMTDQRRRWSPLNMSATTFTIVWLCIILLTFLATPDRQPYRGFAFFGCEFGLLGSGWYLAYRSSGLNRAPDGKYYQTAEDTRFLSRGMLCIAAICFVFSIVLPIECSLLQTELPHSRRIGLFLSCAFAGLFFLWMGISARKAKPPTSR
jgi:hypothetical protein